MKLPQMLLALWATAQMAAAAALTNADVVKMAQAKLDPSIIVTAIENSEVAFDVSAQGLIALSTEQVPQPVVAAMIKRANAPAKAAGTPAKPAAAAAAADDLMSPSEVIFVDGTEMKSMRYLNPQMRTAARALGLGGVATYAVLRGTTASFRTKNHEPSFLVSVPNQAQPESYLTLASLAVRPNGSREVMVGGGYMSYSTGIHPDRVVAVSSEKEADQSKAQKGFTIYKVTPKQKLQFGQYAVILYTGEVQALVNSWFSGGGNSYFDFTVD
jgi:hypothetical protein